MVMAPQGGAGDNADVDAAAAIAAVRAHLAAADAAATQGPPLHTAALLAYRGSRWYDPVAALLALAVSLLPLWQAEEQLRVAPAPPPAAPAAAAAAPNPPAAAAAAAQPEPAGQGGPQEPDAPAAGPGEGGAADQPPVAVAAQ